MKFYLNPFGFIYEKSESPYSPHTRTLRTGMLDKINDAFHVFFGSWNGLPSEKGRNRAYRVGLLDFIPFLGLTVLPLTLIYVAERHIQRGKLANLLSTIGFFFLALFQGTKALVAAILVIPSLFIVAAVNLVSYMFARKEIALAERISFTQQGQGILGAFTTIAEINANYGHQHRYNACAHSRPYSAGQVVGTLVELSVPTKLFNDSDSERDVRRHTFSARPTSEELEALRRLNYFRIAESDNEACHQPNYGILS